MYRKRYQFVVAIFLLFAGFYLLLGEESQQSAETNAIFIRVVDGDTFVAKIDGEEEHVRLLLVDTPEMDHQKGNHEPFAAEAAERMVQLFERNQPIYLEYGTELRDRYDRILAYLYMEDGKQFNKLLIEEGLARVAYVYPPNDKYVDDFYELEEKAKDKNIGIWSIPDYVTDRGFNPPN